MARRRKYYYFFFHGEGKYLTYQINPNDELELISLVATDKNLLNYLNDNQIYHNNLDTLLSAYTKGKVIKHSLSHCT